LIGYLPPSMSGDTFSITTVAGLGIIGAGCWPTGGERGKRRVPETVGFTRSRRGRGDVYLNTGTPMSLTLVISLNPLELWSSGERQDPVRCCRRLPPPMSLLRAPQDFSPEVLPTEALPPGDSGAYLWLFIVSRRFTLPRLGTVSARSLRHFRPHRR
jgi:hypothetical protein